MLDHLQISVPANKFLATVGFYVDVLGTLGYQQRFLVTEGHMLAGLASAGQQTPDFLITGTDDGVEPAASGVHYAFSAKNRHAVDSFHAKALNAGAQDNGAPGIRAHYHPNYYAAYVVDLNGNPIEAVCHGEE